MKRKLFWILALVAALSAGGAWAAVRLPLVPLFPRVVPPISPLPQVPRSEMIPADLPAPAPDALSQRIDAARLAATQA